MNKVMVDTAGWIGAGLLLLAYFAVSFKRLRPDAGSYQALNAFGSLLLIVNTAYYRAYPSAFVNVVWIGIAIAAHQRARRATDEKAASAR